MPSIFKPLLIASLLASAALASHAQPPATDTRQHAHAMGHRAHMDPARMQERIAARQAELKAKLNLNTAQEGAWSDYLAAIKAPARTGKRMDRESRQKMHQEWMALTTPERLDRIAAMKTRRDEMLAQRDARMTQRIQATRNFYDTLTAAQQKVFDANTMMGWHGGHPGKGGRQHG